jgi:hypothetical protein
MSKIKKKNQFSLDAPDGWRRRLTACELCQCGKLATDWPMLAWT